MEEESEAPRQCRHTITLAAKLESQVLTNKICNEVSDFCSGVGCFEGKFGLMVIDDSWPYQTPQEGSICTPGIPEGGARKTTKQQIILPLGIDDTSEGCNNLFLAPKGNG